MLEVSWGEEILVGGQPGTIEGVNEDLDHDGVVVLDPVEVEVLEVVGVEVEVLEVAGVEVEVLEAVEVEILEGKKVDDDGDIEQKL